VNDAEAGAQGSGDEAGARGGANQREMAEGKWMNAGTGTLSNDEVDTKIFHGGIEDFFDSGLQAVNLVEKENLFGFEGSENRGEVAFAFEKRAGAGLNRDIQFVSDDLCEGGLAKARGPVEQHMIESFAAVASGLESDGDVFFDALLADVFVEALGANAGVDARVVVPGDTGNDTRGAPGISSLRRAMVFLGVKSGIFFYVSFAYAFGALRAASATRNNFSKFDVPASRLASDTALSTVRSS
jgi:hypothetical protein